MNIAKFLRIVFLRKITLVVTFDALHALTFITSLRLKYEVSLTRRYFVCTLVCL